MFEHYCIECGNTWYDHIGLKETDHECTECESVSIVTQYVD